MGKIPTGIALRGRNIEIEEVTCPLCKTSDETINHLFTSCIVVSRIWHQISIWCKVVSFIVYTVRELLDLHEHIGLRGLAKEISHGIVMISCISIWRTRNGVKFSNSQARVEDIFSEIK
ncbi:uncharacterized protein LOC110888284 [Helianthus annuus]|uniref:uncharacterized protein LOC110888284 n=1 Tax=Helianthus annuus TaxID=4232 RepID=UPI000B8F00D0|nr:uncharacterized protein LOC110888284 [Helianthus annuus]